MTANAFLQSLRILQLTLVAGYTFVLIISVVLFLIDVVPLLPELQSNMLIDIGVLALAFSGVFSSFYLFQILLLRLDESHSLTRKLSAYKTAYFLRLALIEGFGIIAVVLFMISLSTTALTVSIIIAIVLGLLKPSKKEMIKPLRLNSGEQVQLMSEQSVINDLEQEVFRNRLN